jgi:hypothetical protein
VPIIASEGGDRPKAPPGLHPAVCCDVVDVGMRVNRFGKRQHKVYIVWQLDVVDPDTGARYEAIRNYTLSLWQSNLAKDLQSWRGKPFTAEEKKGFDLERLLGANCQLQIMHQERNGTVYANVESVVPPAKGAPKLVVENYVRVKDQQPRQAPSQEPDYGDDDIPF